MQNEQITEARYDEAVDDPSTGKFSKQAIQIVYNSCQGNGISSFISAKTLCLYMYAYLTWPFKCRLELFSWIVLKCAVVQTREPLWNLTQSVSFTFSERTGGINSENSSSVSDTSC